MNTFNRDEFEAKRRDALEDLKRAVDFFDKVKAAPAHEREGVGSDHYDWLIQAAHAVRATMA